MEWLSSPEAWIALASLTAIEMKPGETAQPAHADDGSIAMPKPHLPISCTAIWALTDFTVENGGTHVVPGSHLADHSPGRDDSGRPRQTLSA